MKNLYEEWLEECGHEDNAEHRADFDRYLEDAIEEHLANDVKDGILSYDEKTKLYTIRRFPAVAAADELRDRIAAAFAALSDDGYFAEADWLCCQSCGVAEIPEEFAESYVFYHGQDAEDLRERGYCHLAWNGDGSHIQERLTEAGLVVDWDHSPKTRFRVTTPLRH